MANKIVNQYHPEWHMNIDELNRYQFAMNNDSLVIVSARRVRQPIESNDDIANAFDSITYQKGSALLNMLGSYMGRDRFREGVRRYLATYAWKNASSADFLAALAGDDTTIAPAFSSFSTSRACLWSRLGWIAMAGRRSLSFPPLGSAGSPPQLWKVPVCARYAAGSGEGRECTLLDQPSGQMTLSKATGCPGWVEANAGADSYYRVLYQGGLLSDLLKDDARPLSLPEKVALIGDISALTGNGKIPLGKAPALVPALARDPAQEVVSKTVDIATGLQVRIWGALGSYFVPQHLAPAYRQYLLDLYGGRARALGWKAKPGESDDDHLLRRLLFEVVAIACGRRPNRRRTTATEVALRGLYWGTRADDGAVLGKDGVRMEQFSTRAPIP